MIVNSQDRQPGRLSVVSKLSLVLAVGLALAACGSEEAAPGGAATSAENTTAPAAATAAAGQEAAPDKVSGLDAEQLREAARKAYSENRLYAPAEDNAVEYYLALREQSPGDASVANALTDLLPMTVIATEQSITREDFVEARRLAALVEEVQPEHPALARLTGNIEQRQQAAIARAAQEKVSAEEQLARQAEIERQRVADQKRQQEQAARELAQKEAADKEAAEAEAARVAQQEAAERRAAEQRAAQARAAAAAEPTADDLRPLSMPAPEFPRDALRSGRSGEVVVEYTVGTDGSVTSARVVRAEPARVFDRAALDAVQRWRFQPISAPVTTRRAIGFNPGT
jgi:protein TonB